MGFGNINIGFWQQNWILSSLLLCTSPWTFSLPFFCYIHVRQPSSWFQWGVAMGIERMHLSLRLLYLLVPLLFTQSPSRSKGQTCRNTTQSAKIYRDNICILVLIKTLTRIKAYCFQESLGLPLYRSWILFSHQETAIFFSRWGTMALAPPTLVCALKRNGCPSMWIKEESSELWDDWQGSLVTLVGEWGASIKKVRDTKWFWGVWINIWILVCMKETGV